MNSYISTFKKPIRESVSEASAQPEKYFAEVDAKDVSRTMLRISDSPILDQALQTGDLTIHNSKVISTADLDIAQELYHTLTDANIKLTNYYFGDLEEISTTAGVPGYQTPYAFGAADDDTIEMLGYKRVKKVKKESKNESQFMKLSKELYLNEIAYNDYKKDPIASPKQKINQSIKFINKGLKEIEKVVNHNVRLKQEMGIDNSMYWKSSRESLSKINERLLRVSKQLKELGA